MLRIKIYFKLTKSGLRALNTADISKHRKTEPGYNSSGRRRTGFKMLGVIRALSDTTVICDDVIRDRQATDTDIRQNSIK